MADKRIVDLNAASSLSEESLFAVYQFGASWKATGAQIMALAGQSSVLIAADEYNSSSTYLKGAYCAHEGNLYVSKQAINPAEEWNASHWQQIKILTQMETRIDEEIAETASDVVAAEYNPESTYLKGAYCIHDRKLYYCPAAIVTAEAWNAEHWTEVKIMPKIEARIDEEIAETASDVVAAEYSSSSGYLVGQYCVHDRKLYKCNHKIELPGEAWHAAHWDQTTVGVEILDISGDIEKIKADISLVYSAESAYSVGDYCLKDAVLYRCNTAISSSGEAWTAAHWTAVNIGTALNLLVYSISNEYDATASYKKNDTCIHNGHLYICTTDTSTPAGAWASASWSVGSVEDILSVIKKKLEDVIVSLANEYTERTYAVGAYCRHWDSTSGGYLLYKCTTEIDPAETWTAAHWTQVNIGDELAACNGGYSALLASIAGEYSASGTYAYGAYCYHDNKLYVCTEAGGISSETWTAAHWRQITVMAQMEARIDEEIEETASDIVAAEYTQRTYSQGEYCIHDRKLYISNQAINPAEAWTPAHWTQIKVMVKLEEHIDEEIEETASDIVAAEYTQRTYSQGEYCIHDRKLYFCPADIGTAEAWNSSHWTEIKVMPKLEARIDEEIAETTTDIIAAEYAVQAYAEGAFCTRGRKLYICTSEIADPGEAWNSEHWNEIKIMSWLGTLASLNFVEVTS